MPIMYNEHYIHNPCICLSKNTVCIHILYLNQKDANRVKKITRRNQKALITIKYKEYTE